MHFSNIASLSFLALLASVNAYPRTVKTRSGQLMKRNFWCDNVDSENICQPGQRMTPMNDHACDLLKAAGKLDQVSPPEGSESSVTCPGQSSSGAATTGTGTSTGTGNGTTTDTASASSSSGAGDAGTVGGDKLAQSTTPLNGTASMAQEKLSVQPPKKTLKIECTLPDGDLTASESVQCTIDSGASSVLSSRGNVAVPARQ